MLISAQAFPPASGGIEDLMRGLAVHAAAAGREVRVLADAKEGDREFDAAVRASGAPFAIERFGGFKPLRRWLKARRIASLGRAARGGRADGHGDGRDVPLFADSWKSLELLDRAAWPGPVHVWAHGNEYPAHDRKDGRIRQALARADVILPVSRDTVARLEGRTPDHAEIRLTHPPVWPPVPASAADLAWAEGEWAAAGAAGDEAGPGSGAPRCLCLCRLIAWKGVDRALEALAELGRGTLLIAGDGPQRAELEAMAASLSLSGRVRFLGPVAGGRKTALLQTASLFLQPGRRIGDQREGYGISYLEAALAGLPAISGCEGGAPEAALDGETALVVNAAHAGPVTAALRRLAGDDGLRARLSAGARAHGEANLWPARIAGILAPPNAGAAQDMTQPRVDAATA